MVLHHVIITWGGINSLADSSSCDIHSEVWGAHTGLHMSTCSCWPAFSLNDLHYHLGDIRALWRKLLEPFLGNWLFPFCLKPPRGSLVIVISMAVIRWFGCEQLRSLCKPCPASLLPEVIHKAGGYVKTGIRQNPSPTVCGLVQVSHSDCRFYIPEVRSGHGKHRTFALCLSPKMKDSLWPSNM